jgi:hypothetical protein
LDLLSAESQPILRELFRKYLDSRLEVYHKFGDLEAVTIDLAKCSKLQMDIWAQAVAASRLPGSHDDAAKLLLPALNSRTMAARMHPPPAVYALMLLLALACSLLAGYSMPRRLEIVYKQAPMPLASQLTFTSWKLDDLRPVRAIA